ncbi:anillin-like isoform X3 [Arapaima gigas]
MDSVRQVELCQNSSEVDLLQLPDRSLKKEGGNAVAGLKRQRDPLSDTEENVLCITEPHESLKRRCLDPVGNENLNPLESPPQSSLRQAELKVKPDTPAISSVQSRLQQLIRNQGVFPGGVEFRSRLERFELQKQAHEEHPDTSTPRSCTLSSLARTMQERLHNAETPSMSRAARIRQEREEELRLLRSQPISDNPWLKRSLSDLSDTEVNLAPLLPSSTRVMRQCRKWQWPPLHPWDGRPVMQEEDELKSTSDGQLRQAGCDTMKKPALPEPLLDSSEAPSSPSRPEYLNSQGEMSTSKIIDQLFEGVLDTTEEENQDDSGSTYMVKEGPEDERKTCLVEEGHKDDDAHLQEDGTQEEPMGKEIAVEGDASESRMLENSVDELLDLAPNYMLSPLSKSVEAAVTPLRLASGPFVDPQPLKPGLEGLSDLSSANVPLYSIDTYRTLQQNSQRPTQISTPAVRRLNPQSPHSEPPVSRKDRIKVLTEEAARLQAIIAQTVQALNCCTDEGHGKGSLEEAEAERLLLISCEKRTALLTEVSRLRAEGTEASEVSDHSGQQPCRGTVRISNIQLPLKVEFVCTSRTQPGRATCYFFILIRYEACNIVATPLASASDAHNGDTISFSTSITLQDVRASFEIDVEVYSLVRFCSSVAHNLVMLCLSVALNLMLGFLSLSLIAKGVTSQSASQPVATLPSVGAQRSSKFCLVGSHKVTLASLGQTKFLLDKMKFDGKIRRLLGDEFQEKVPFLSPLEGHIYMQLDCDSHSSVQHKGFLTMFEDVCGFGAWQRRWFSLDGAVLSYWHYPNDECSKPPEGRISLASTSSLCVRPVKRNSCARPCTFELVSSKVLQEEEDDSSQLNKCWFSADIVDEQTQWMEKLNQALLDLHTWSPLASEAQTCKPPRESIL